MDAWLIYFDDANRKPELFTGEGAEQAAHRRYDALLTNWNCHLFQKIELDRALCCLDEHQLYGHIPEFFREGLCGS